MKVFGKHKYVINFSKIGS